MTTEKKEKEIKYSYSRLECLDQCGFRYWLKYIEKHKPTTSSIAFDFGTLTHSIEEEIGNCIKDHKPINYEALKEQYASKCVEIQQKYPVDFITPDKTGRTYPDKINFYLNTGIYRLEKFMNENPDLEIVGTEIPFNFSYLDTQQFRGFIDRVLRNKVTGKYIVQDIKTYSAKLDDAHLRTPLQFVVYCIAICKDFHCEPQDISCSYDLPLCDAVQSAGTPGFIERGCKKLDKLFKKIDDEDWTPKPSALCGWCEYSHNNDSAGDDTKWLCPYLMNYTKTVKNFSKENEWTGLPNYNSLLEAYHTKYGVKTEEKIDKNIC